MLTDSCSFQKHRQQATKRRQVVRPNKPKRESGEPLRFAQQTVSSVLKQQPEVIYQPKKVIPRSPKRNEIPDDVFISHGTLRQRDEEIVSYCYTDYTFVVVAVDRLMDIQTF